MADLSKSSALSLFLMVASDLSLGFTFHLDSMRTMDHAIQNRIGQRRILHPCMPFRNRHLGYQDGGRSLMPVIADFQKIAGLRGFQYIPEPIIQDQQIDSCEFVQELAVCSISA